MLQDRGRESAPAYIATRSCAVVRSQRPCPQGDPVIDPVFPALRVWVRLMPAINWRMERLNMELTLVFDDEAAYRLGILRAKTASDYAEVIKNGLRLYEWLISRTEMQRKLYEKNDAGEFVEVV